MYWVPVIFVTFKLVVFGIGMFFAIKWHHDQEKNTDKRRLPRIAGKAAAIFALSLVGLMLVTFGLARMLDMDLIIP
jgi:ABC-type Co2+ transport system permease subunit